MTGGALPPVRTDTSARPPLPRELMIGLAVFAVYVIVTARDRPGRHEAAVANGRWIFDVERALHIDVEPALNRWLARQGTLRVAANYEYAITYVITSFGLLFWLYARRASTYPRARTSFILINLVAITCFALYPVAPPRLIKDLGFVDTVLLDRTWGSWGSRMLAHANQRAAMPSLHFAWVLWVSLMLAPDPEHKLGRALNDVHTVVSLLVIMATGNHYLLDAVAGAVLALASVAIAKPRSRKRPVGPVRAWIRARRRAGLRLPR